MKYRWIKQLIHQELDITREKWMQAAAELPVKLDVDCQLAEVEQNNSLSKETEEEATRVKAGLTNAIHGVASIDYCTWTPENDIRQEGWEDDEPLDDSWAGYDELWENSWE